LSTCRLIIIIIMVVVVVAPLLVLTPTPTTLPALSSHLGSSNPGRRLVLVVG
jgi:hypothetical protein